tara:strand:- start:791 stop:1030 length:240 start_codon:yes stop_codon:yes gene_type:complete
MSTTVVLSHDGEDTSMEWERCHVSMTNVRREHVYVGVPIQRQHIGRVTVLVGTEGGASAADVVAELQRVIAAYECGGTP